MSMQTYEKNAELIEFAKTLDYVPWCEEYEKMISGMLHDENVPELVNARFRARKWMKKFNGYFPDDATPESLGADRQKMLGEVLGRLGKNSYIEPPFRIDYGANISVGEGLYANYNLCILDCGIVKLGNRVLFGPNVSLFAVTHDAEIASRRRFEDFAGYITIGDDCWIGGNAIIMPNVTIGKGCTIGAGSIVTRDVPDFSIAVGAPARVTRKVEAVPDV